jgi:hypothetical protein
LYYFTLSQAAEPDYHHPLLSVVPQSTPFLHRQTAVLCYCKRRSLLFATIITCTLGTGSFRAVKRPERGVDHSPTAGAEVKGRVELALHQLPLWAFMACSRVNLPLRVIILSASFLVLVSNVASVVCYTRLQASVLGPDNSWYVKIGHTFSIRHSIHNVWG